MSKIKPGEFNNIVISELFKKHFKGKSPLELTTDQKTVLAKQLKAHLTGLKNITPHQHQNPKLDAVFVFNINEVLTDHFERYPSY